MRAIVLDNPGEALQLRDIPKPTPCAGEVLIKVHACGVCRTDLHVVDGDLTEPALPIVPGHQIIGTVAAIGNGVSSLATGQRVGVPWLGGSCGECRYCRSERENLCDHARYTGYQINGGFAEYCVADAHFCFPIPEEYPDLQAAPLLCAGLIGYRSLRMAGDQAFAKKLGAVWAKGSDQVPDEPLDAAIIFAPVGDLVPAALKAVAKGGIVVCAGIHMSDIPSFPYSILWEERVLRSVANLTRRDGEEFLALAPMVPVKTEVHPYPLEKAGDALDDLRAGRFDGAAVIVVDEAASR